MVLISSHALSSVHGVVERLFYVVRICSRVLFPARGVVKLFGCMMLVSSRSLFCIWFSRRFFCVVRIYSRALLYRVQSTCLVRVKTHGVVERPFYTRLVSSRVLCYAFGVVELLSCAVLFSSRIIFCTRCIRASLLR
jgi:hypothetical protein